MFRLLIRTFRDKYTFKVEEFDQNKPASKKRRIRHTFDKTQNDLIMHEFTQNPDADKFPHIIQELVKVVFSQKGL